MKTYNRRTLVSLMGSAALTACAAPQTVSQSVTDPFEGGIGGTGIVGQLTDFGSLVVNGLRVELTSRTRIATAYGDTTDSALTRGQSLTLYATRSRDRLVAQRVTIDYALVGVVRRTAGGLTVNGVPVETDTGTAGRAVPGRRAAISGTWHAGGVVATRIDQPPDGPDLIAGTLERRSGTGPSVGGAALVGPTGGTAPGSYITAFGRATERGFETDRVASGRFNGIGDLRQLSVDGYLEPVEGNPGFRVAGLGHSFARDLRLAPLSGRRAIYFGRYAGVFRAQLGLVVPDTFPARRALLRDGYADGFRGEVLRL